MPHEPTSIWTPVIILVLILLIGLTFIAWAVRQHGRDLKKQASKKLVRFYEDALKQKWTMGYTYTHVVHRKWWEFWKPKIKAVHIVTDVPDEDYPLVVNAKLDQDVDENSYS